MNQGEGEGGYEIRRGEGGNDRRGEGGNDRRGEGGNDRRGEGGNDRPPRRRNFRSRVYRRRPFQGQGDEEPTGDAPVSSLTY